MREGLVDAAQIGMESETPQLAMQVITVARTAERMMVKVAGAGGLPLIGLSNRIDAFPPEGVLLLETGDSIWMLMIRGLVERARRIYMAFGALTPGVREELQTIQLLEREDDTLILLSHEPEAPFPFLGAPPPPALPDPATVRGRLATFGHVLEEGDLEASLRARDDAAA